MRGGGRKGKNKGEKAEKGGRKKWDEGRNEKVGNISIIWTRENKSACSVKVASVP